MIQRIHILMFLLLVVGCAPPSSRPPVAPSQQPTLLDQALETEKVVMRKKVAEQDLPTDTWHTHPKGGRYNVSRSSREGELAHELLAQIKPRLKQMPVRDLLDSLKTFPLTDYGSFLGVAYYIYRDGNQMIIAELASRPRSELESLRALGDDRREVFTGDSGPPCSIGDLVRYTFLDEPK